MVARDQDAIDIAGRAAYLVAPQSQFVDVRATLVNVQHMTPDTANAMKEVARYTHAVPAEEATKQAAEVTKQATELTKQSVHWVYRVGLVCVAVIVAMVLIAVVPAAASGIGVVVGVLALAVGGTYATSLYINKVQAPKAAAEVASKAGPPELG